MKMASMFLGSLSMQRNNWVTWSCPDFRFACTWDAASHQSTTV